NHALERFAPAVGRIELGAVFQPAAVLGRDQRAFDSGFAVTRLDVDDVQFVAHVSTHSLSPSYGARTQFFAEFAVEGNPSNRGRCTCAHDPRPVALTRGADCVRAVAAISRVSGLP